VEAELLWFVWVTVFDAFSLAMAYALAYRWRKQPSFYRYFEPALAKTLLAAAWPLVLSAIVVTLYMRIDQLMIKAMLGETEVGIYAAAVRISEAFYFLPSLITASLFPAILNAKKLSLQRYQQRLQQLYTFMVWLALGIALPMTFAADWLIVILFGKTYVAAGQVLVVHAWSMIFVFLGVASGKWFLAENLIMLTFWRTMLGVIVNIVLNVMLIPSHGLMGAAWATLFSQASAAYLFDAFHPKTKDLFWMKSKTLLLRLK
jgi:O-antigen/teichoic acid export membrane protein